MDVQKIPMTLITLPAELHRRAHDAARLEELAASIKALGLINPITVEREADHYVLRAGHRRYEAHRLLRLDTIEANIRDAGALAHGEVLTWAENLDRADLSPIEEAEALARMLTVAGMTVERASKHLRRSRDWIEERLKLLTAPRDLQDLVHARELPMRHAYELARVTDDQHRHHLTRYALLSGASYPVIRDWVAQWRLHAESEQPGTAPLPAYPPDGGRITIMIPCLTCGTAHPHEQLRVVRMCPDCHANVLQATEDWRRVQNQVNPAQHGENGIAGSPGSPETHAASAVDTQVSPQIGSAGG